MEEELDKDVVCHQFCSTGTANALPRKLWKGLETSIINTLKYADDVVLLAKEEKVLQDMIDKLIEIGGCYGMEMNVEKTKVMRISGQPFPVQIMIDQKQLENVESFKYLGSILTNDGRCTCEMKCRTLWLKLHSIRRWLFLLAHWTWN
jgi:hypothetical protein